jgi:MFS transporter, AAHS family, 4-hydroxybenzoate transporter
MVAVTSPLAAEFANERRRPLAVAVMCSGYPIGGTLGGFAAAALLRVYEWPSVFLLGACIAILLLPLVLIWLPESPAYLLSRNDARSQARLRNLMARFGHDHIEFRSTEGQGPRNIAYQEIFSGSQRGVTLRIAATNFLFVITTYYVLSWMPQMVVDRGFSPSAATALSATATMTGVVASLAMGWLVSRLPPRAVVGCTMIALGICTPLFALAPSSMPALLVMAVLIGTCIFGGTTGLYGIIASSFETRMRVTGAGFVIGMGRGSSAIAPAAAGALFALEFSRVGVSAALGAAAFVAGLILLLLKGRGN